MWFIGNVNYLRLNGKNWIVCDGITWNQTNNLIDFPRNSSSMVDPSKEINEMKQLFSKYSSYWTKRNHLKVPFKSSVSFEEVTKWALRPLRKIRSHRNWSIPKRPHHWQMWIICVNVAHYIIKLMAKRKLKNGYFKCFHFTEDCSL